MTEPDTPARRAQRAREQIEQELAPLPGDAPVTRGALLVPLALCAVVLAAILAWRLSPAPDPARDRAATAPDPAVVEAQRQLQARLEAERERAKKLERGSDYFERTAAAEAALLKDLAANAERVAAAVEAAPKAKPARAPAAESRTPAPTPETRTETASAPPPAGPAAAPAPQPAPASQAAASSPPPAQVASAAPATATPEPAVKEAAAECHVHVSELSTSGKLTYEDVVRMNGARLNEKTRHVRTPPVELRNRVVVFDVAPNGCVTIVNRDR